MNARLVAGTVFLTAAAVAVAHAALQGQPAEPVHEAPQIIAVPEPQPLAIKPAITYFATPIPLADVRLTGGPLQQAQQVDEKFLLSLDPDRMLYYLRQRAGLQPKAARGYGGWDGPGRNLTGHIAGHYLSAMSYMFAATGNKQFKDRADYIVGELAEIQAAQKDGYIGALMGTPPGQRGAGGGGRGAQPVDGKQLFEAVRDGNIRSGGFDLNGMWSPWYVEHKIFSGLRDAYRETGNKQALEVETKFAGWIESIVGNLSDAQLNGYITIVNGQPRRTPGMLDTEFGGINESLADLYADTGDKRWLLLSDKFEHRAIIDPLARGIDVLPNKHGNTQIPKLLGELKRYIYTGDEIDGNAAHFFWDEVALHHSFATGGDGRNEYFGQPDKFEPMLDGRTCESCNVYNMLKMTRDMFAVQPDVKYADFHERALFNHVLASINPLTGGLAYMVPIGQHITQEDDDNMSFTCCVGTGMENHALHGLGLYYTQNNHLWVNLFAPSVADWKEQNVKLDMETDFPEGEHATLKFTVDSPKPLEVSIRRPWWAGQGYTLAVNGEPVKNVSAADSYINISRTWNSGDTISMTLPKELHKDVLPDDPDKAALMWGPLVLAADMGPRDRGGGGGGRGRGAAPAEPIFISAAKAVAGWLKPESDANTKEAEFKATATLPSGGSEDFNFVPFYRMHNRSYGIYFDVMTQDDYAKRGGAVAAQQASLDRLKAATVGFAQPGQMQTERDFNYQAGEDSAPVVVQDHAGRNATSWFSMDVPVEDTHPMVMIVTYSNEEAAARTFDVLVDGEKVGQRTSPHRSPEEQVKFDDVEYKLSEALVKGKSKVTVKFQADTGSRVGNVYGIRMIRGDAQR